MNLNERIENLEVILSRHADGSQPLMWADLVVVQEMHAKLCRERALEAVRFAENVYAETYDALHEGKCSSASIVAAEHKLQHAQQVYDTMHAYVNRVANSHYTGKRHQFWNKGA